MEPTTTCRACAHEFDRPAYDQAGPGCPRCGERVAPAVGADNSLGAAVGGCLLGALVAALIILSGVGAVRP